MSDIVERLRQFADDDVDETARDGTLEAADIRRWSALMREAKVEIERLRAGGCARDQHTTQFCGELRAAVKAENEACALAVEGCDALGPDFTDAELTSEGYIARKKVKQCAAAIRARMEAQHD